MFNKSILVVLMSIIVFISCGTRSIFIDPLANDASYNNYEYYETTVNSSSMLYSNSELGNVNYVINNKTLTKEAFFNQNLKKIQIIKDEKIIKEMGFNEIVDTVILGIL